MYEREQKEFNVNLETGKCEYTIRSYEYLRILFDGEGNVLPVKVNTNNIGKQFFDMNSEPYYLMELEYNGNKGLKLVRFYQIIDPDYIEEHFNLDLKRNIDERVFKNAFKAEMNLVRFGQEIDFKKFDWLNDDISKENSSVRITLEILIRNYVLLHMKKQE